jgi:hypothetical protein
MVGKFVQHHHLPSALRGFITHGLSFSRRSSSTGDAILAHSGQCEQVRTIRTEAGRTNKNGDLAQVSVIAENWFLAGDRFRVKRLQPGSATSPFFGNRAFAFSGVKKTPKAAQKTPRRARHR